MKRSSSSIEHSENAKVYVDGVRALVSPTKKSSYGNDYFDGHITDGRRMRIVGFKQKKLFNSMEHEDCDPFQL